MDWEPRVLEADFLSEVFGAFGSGFSWMYSLIEYVLES